MGGGLDAGASATRLRCRWVVGSANNQLSEDGVADALGDQGIGYVPDFVANAGGLICVAQELDGMGRRAGWTPPPTGSATWSAS